MRIPMYNVIVAFPTEESQAAPARMALRWGSMHILGKPLIAPFNNQEYEVRTYQFAKESIRKRFKERILTSLENAKVELEMEDEAASRWVPDDPFPGL